MKIRNKFIIPVIAVLLAVLMTGGSVTIVAADTTVILTEETTTTAAPTTTDPAFTHPHTYTTTTMPATSSLEEEIEEVVSNVMGDNFEGVGEDIRDASNLSGMFLRAFRNFIDTLIEFAKKLGDFFGGGFLQPATTTTATAAAETTAP